MVNEALTALRDRVVASLRPGRLNDRRSQSGSQGDGFSLSR